MAKTKYPANVVGKEIQRRRYQLGLTQEAFAARCQLRGLNITRATVSQIEAQVRCVKDSELLALAAVLDVSTDTLYPANLMKPKRKRQK